jgi:hypothetical protein
MVNVARACCRIDHQQDDQFLLEIAFAEAFVGPKVPSLLEESGKVVIGRHSVLTESRGLEMRTDLRNRLTLSLSPSAMSPSVASRQAIDIEAEASLRDAKDAPLSFICCRKDTKSPGKMFSGANEVCGASCARL